MKKVAIITGSAKRLGKDIALSLATQGYSIAIHYNSSQEEANALTQQLKAMPCEAFAFQCDVKEASQVKSFIENVIEKFGRIDLLINNVGIYQPKNIESVSVEEWNETIQTNLNGAFYASHYCLPHLTKTKGNIINIGYSGSENISPNTEATAYAISKTGLLLLTKSLAKQLGTKQIRVNMVSPGQLEYSIDLPQNIEEAIPLQRAGKSKDITETIKYFLNNDYITGVNIDVAGGYML